MAHQIETMAFVGQTPWHGLGNQLTQNQPIEIWAQQAGMDWRIESSNVRYKAKNDRGQNILMPYEEQRVIRKSSPKKSWSFTATLPSNRALNWKRRVYSKVGVSSGHWQEQDSRQN